MSVAQPVKSGQNQTLKISNASSKNISAVARCLLSTLRLAAHRLPASGSLQELTLLSLYQSMTPVQRAALIGHLRKLNDSVGSLFVEFLRIDQCQRYSRTGSMTSPSSGERMVSVHFQPAKTLCSSITRSSRKALRG